MLISAEDLVSIDAARATVVAAPFLAWRESVVIDVAGMTCAVHFDDAEAAAKFRLRYTDLLSLGSTPERHAFAMRDPELGWLFWSGTSTVLRWPHGDLPAHAVAFLADAVALTAWFRSTPPASVCRMESWRSSAIQTPERPRRRSPAHAPKWMSTAMSAA
jgi:hypothetical protein